MPTAPTPEGGTNDRVGEYASRFLSPCEVHQCRSRQRCKDERLACKSFGRFVSRDYGKRVDPPSEPSREIFETIYPEDDDE